MEAIFFIIYFLLQLTNLCFLYLSKIFQLWGSCRLWTTRFFNGEEGYFLVPNKCLFRLCSCVHVSPSRMRSFCVFVIKLSPCYHDMRPLSVLVVSIYHATWLAVASHYLRIGYSELKYKCTMVCLERTWQKLELHDGEACIDCGPFSIGITMVNFGNIHLLGFVSILT